MLKGPAGLFMNRSFEPRQGPWPPVSGKHWGGEEGLAKRRPNDARKRLLCQKLGYRLVELRYDQPITEDAVRKLLGPYLWNGELKPDELTDARR